MVQRLAYLAFTEEAGVRLPVTEIFLYHFLSSTPSNLQTEADLTNSCNKLMLYFNSGAGNEQSTTVETSLPCHGSLKLHWSHSVEYCRRGVGMTRSPIKDPKLIRPSGY
jgi:hypothetical protein